MCEGDKARGKVITRMTARSAEDHIVRTWRTAEPDGANGAGDAISGGGDGDGDE